MLADERGRALPQPQDHDHLDGLADAEHGRREAVASYAVPSAR
jgi:hypothetical protein